MGHFRNFFRDDRAGDTGDVKAEKPESYKVYAHIEQHNMERAIARLLRRKHGRVIVETLTPLLEKFPLESLKALAVAVEGQLLLRSGNAK